MKREEEEEEKEGANFSHISVFVLIVVLFIVALAVAIKFGKGAVKVEIPPSNLITRPFTHKHTNPVTHGHTNPSTHIHTNPSTHIHTNPSTHIHTNPSTHIHTNPSTHIHTNPSTHVHTRALTRPYTNPSTHIHTNPHTIGSPSVLIYYSGVTSTGAALGTTPTATEAACASVAPRNDCRRTPALLNWSGNTIPNWPTTYNFNPNSTIYGATGVITNSWSNLMIGFIFNNSFSGAGVGGMSSPSYAFWSGTTTNGALSTNTCNGWTDSTSGHTGQVGAGGTAASTLWSIGGNPNCNNNNPFLCACIYGGDPLT